MELGTAQIRQSLKITLINVKHNQRLQQVPIMAQDGLCAYLTWPKSLIRLTLYQIPLSRMHHPHDTINSTKIPFPTFFKRYFEQIITTLNVLLLHIFPR